MTSMPCLPRLSPVDAAGLHGLVDAFERQGARLGQPEPDRSDLAQGRVGGQDLGVAGGGADACCDVHAAALIVAALACRLGRVDADADRRREAMLPAVPSQPPLDVDCALDAVDRSFEGDEEAVT